MVICRGVRNVRNPRPNERYLVVDALLAQRFVTEYGQNLKVRDLTIIIVTITNC